MEEEPVVRIASFASEDDSYALCSDQKELWQDSAVIGVRVNLRLAKLPVTILDCQTLLKSSTGDLEMLPFLLYTYIKGLFKEILRRGFWSNSYSSYRYKRSKIHVRSGTGGR